MGIGFIKALLHGAYTFHPMKEFPRYKFQQL